MLPSRLATSVVWTDGGSAAKPLPNEDEREASKPDLELPVFRFDTESETPVRLTETELLGQVAGREKRRRLALQGTPGTPASRATGTQDDDEDDAASVLSNDEESASKWPFEEVFHKLQAAAWEVRQLAEVLRTQDVSVVRVERLASSVEERRAGLQLGIQKRTEAFGKARGILQKGVEDLEKEVKNQRDFIGKLERISKKWKIVAPGHPTTVSSSLKPEEPLAIVLETGHLEGVDDMVLIHRTAPAQSGISFSSLDGKADDSHIDFRAHGVIAKLVNMSPPYRVLGQASTVLRSVVDDTDGMAALPLGRMVVGVDDHTSLDKRIEARFKDAHARALIRRLHSQRLDDQIRLGEDAVLKFELVPDEKPFGLINSNDAVCSVALNLLERGKSAEVIQKVCLQKLMLPKYVEALNRTPGAMSIVWRTDEDDEDIPERVRSRCCIEVGRTGKHALEFVLADGQLTFDWCTINNYHPKSAKGLLPAEALQIASEVSVRALVHELIDLVVAMKTDSSAERVDFTLSGIQADSFQVTHKSGVDKLGFSILVSVSEKQRLGVRVEYRDPDRSAKDISADPFYMCRRIFYEQRRLAGGK